MIEVEMNEDIRKFETKLIGSFTKRQVICALLGVIFGYIVMSIFSAIAGITDTVTKFMIASMFAMPLFMCGWGKMRGVPFEIYFVKMIYRIFLTPCVRKYKSMECRNELEKIRKKEEYEKINKMSKKEQKQYKKKKKNITYSKKEEYKIYR